MVKNYIPSQGDIVYLNFSPAAGREQKGIRPALVMSKALSNERSGLALIAPITSKQKKYPFEVVIEEGEIAGVALVDQVRAIDFVAREFRFVARVKDPTLEEARAKFLTLI